MRSLALLFGVAWLSLLAQWRPLLGSDGLLPVAALMARLRERGVAFGDFPTL